MRRVEAALVMALAGCASRGETARDAGAGIADAAATDGATADDAGASATPVDAAIAAPAGAPCFPSDRKWAYIVAGAPPERCPDLADPYQRHDRGCDEPLRGDDANAFFSPRRIVGLEYRGSCH